MNYGVSHIIKKLAHSLLTYNNICLTDFFTGSICFLGSVKLVELIMYGCSKVYTTKLITNHISKVNDDPIITITESDSVGEIDSVCRDADAMIANAKNLLNLPI